MGALFACGTAAVRWAASCARNSASLTFNWFKMRRSSSVSCSSVLGPALWESKPSPPSLSVAKSFSVLEFQELTLSAIFKDAWERSTLSWVMSSWRASCLSSSQSSQRPGLLTNVIWGYARINWAFESKKWIFVIFLGYWGGIYLMNWFHLL